MNNAVTYLGLIHVGLMIAFIVSLGGVVWFWLSVFAAGMSDSPQTGGLWIPWMIFAHAFPGVLFIAWWFT